MAFLGFQCRPNDLHFSFKLAPASVVSSNRTECQNENNVSDFVSDHVLCDFWLGCSRFAKKIYQKNVVVCQFFTDSVHHTVSIHHWLRGNWKKAYCWFNSEKVQYNFLNNVQVIQKLQDNYSCTFDKMNFSKLSHCKHNANSNCACLKIHHTLPFSVNNFKQ